ncbi:MAG: hypothetical protein B9S28_03825, partial [Opitutia bacterium Tous-C10FEB]
MSALTRLFLWLVLMASSGAVALAATASAATFPRELSTYAQSPAAGLWSVLQARVAAEPFNLAATAIFICAVLHTFLAPKISQWGRLVEERHRARLQQQRPTTDRDDNGQPDEVSFGGQILHFFGEVEAVFGIWAV